MEDRKAIVKLNTGKYQLPMIYCNAVGSQTEIVFDGASLVFDKDSNLIRQLPLFEEAYAVFDLQDDGRFLQAVQVPAAALPSAEFNPDKSF